ncbi:MAG: outer membrane beta-barrel protein [Akkermansiaceae bacterium]|nr:outer membrane beta-barrel protein [Armatimonadota bacterium]
MRSQSLVRAAALSAAALTLTSLALAQDTQKPTSEGTPEAAAPVSSPAPGVVVTGVIEANYTVNFNEPFTHQNKFYYFNRREGQFALNLAEVQIAKAATPESRTGFVIKLVEGEVKRFNFITPDADTNNLLEAYGTMLIPVGTRELKFDAGQFETHVGYETVEIGTNNFFSHNYLFGIPSPFYNAGVRASYPVSSRLTVNGYIYNRYNGRTDDGNRDLAPGFQISYLPSATSSLVLNGLGSRENLADIGVFSGEGAPTGTVPRQQSVLDLIYTNQINPTTKFVFEGLYRFGKDDADNSYNFAGAAVYGIFGPLGIRAEYMADTKGTFILGGSSIGANIVNPNDSGDKASLGSVTLSYEPKVAIFPNSRTIIEARYDFASERFFEKETAGSLSKNQTTLTIGQVYSF